MNFELEPFEQELRQAFARRPAPPGLKEKILERRNRARTRFVGWQRLAASLVLAAMAAGGVQWHNREERRKAEEARAQVMTAFRIANRALEKVSDRLADHDPTGH